MSEPPWTPSVLYPNGLGGRKLQIKELPPDLRRAYNRSCGQKHRDKRRLENGPRVLVDSAKAEENRAKARKHYHKKKEEDPVGTLQRGRDHQALLRQKKSWGPVQKTVAAAIKSVLAPYKASDAAARRAAYLERNRLAQNLRQRLRAVLKRAGAMKADHTLSLVGCTIKEYYEHMESQLPSGSTMKDMSCDHIFPLKMYNLVDPQQQRKANTLSNLQPLPMWGKNSNASKRDKLPTKEMASKVEPWAWPDGVTMDMLPDYYDD